MEKLLVKRYEVIAYYPNSPFEIGEILHKTVHTYDGIRHCIPIGEVEKCPAIFKELQWWEKRDISGWVFGEVKDAELKTHPCIVPFNQLPEFQQKKDKLFCSIVDALK